MNKPPIGIEPKYIHDEFRLSNLNACIVRYIEAGYPIKVEWVEERNEIIERYRK